MWEVVVLRPTRRQIDLHYALLFSEGPTGGNVRSAGDIAPRSFSRR